MTTSPFLLFANNAGSTLAGSISNSAVSANLQAGGGALFPNPTSPQYFVGTFIDAATGLLREIVWITARSTDTITMIRAQEGTTALAWNAGDLFQELWTAGQAGAMLQSNQFIIPSTNFYVDNTIGNNSYTGTSATVGANNTGPWATLAYALPAISAYNLGGQTVTLQLGTTGTYPGGVSFNAPSSGTLVIQGNVSSQSSYVISATPASGGAVLAVSSGTVKLNGLTITNVGGGSTTFGVQSFDSNVSLTNVSLFTSSPVPFALINAGAGGSITILSGCIINGFADAALFSQTGGSIIQAANVATNGTPAFSTAFALAEVLGTISVATNGSWTWTGSGATGSRYSAALNAVINTNGGGADYYPGNSAGSTATGGQYA